MSYSPFAVLGTSQRIKKTSDRLKKSVTQEEPKEEKKIDFTEEFRKKYFEKSVDKSSYY